MNVNETLYNYDHQIDTCDPHSFGSHLVCFRITSCKKEGKIIGSWMSFLTIDLFSYSRFNYVTFIFELTSCLLAVYVVLGRR